MPSSDNPPQPKRVTWVVFGLLLVCVVFVLAWYATIRSEHQREQEAILALSSMFDPERVLVLTGEGDPQSDYDPADVDLVFTLAPTGSDWIRGVVEPVGGPLLTRVRSVKIYESRFTSDMVAQLMQFQSMNALHLPPDAGEDRSIFAPLITKVDKLAVYLEHDNEDYMRGSEGDEAEMDEEGEEDDPVEDEDEQAMEEPEGEPSAEVTADAE